MLSAVIFIKRICHCCTCYSNDEAYSRVVLFLNLLTGQKTALGEISKIYWCSLLEMLIRNIYSIPNTV